MGSKIVAILVLTLACGFVPLLFISPPIHLQHYSSAAILRVQLADLEGGLDMYRLEVGRYPSTAEGLEALMKDPGAKNWAGPYLKKKWVPRDPWGYAFHYRGDQSGQSYDLWSYGADGLPGGEELNGDCHMDDCQCREPTPPLAQRLLGNAVGWLLVILTSIVIQLAKLFSR